MLLGDLHIKEKFSPVIQNSTVPGRNGQVDADFNFGVPCFTEFSVSSPFHRVTAVTTVAERGTGALFGRNWKNNKSIVTDTIGRHLDHHKKAAQKKKESGLNKIVKARYEAEKIRFKEVEDKQPNLRGLYKLDMIWEAITRKKAYLVSKNCFGCNFR